MFYEECNQLVTNPLNGGFKEDFSPHVYDEQEGDVRKEESLFELMVEEGPLCVFQTQVSPEDLHEHTQPSLLV